MKAHYTCKESVDEEPGERSKPCQDTSTRPAAPKMKPLLKLDVYSIFINVLDIIGKNNNKLKSILFVFPRITNHISGLYDLSSESQPLTFDPHFH